MEVKKKLNSKTIISFLALSALAAALTTSGKSSFSIQQVAIQIPPIHPAILYARAHAKYGVEVPHNVSLAARSAKFDSLAATPFQNDVGYLCPVKLGRNTLMLDFDTGSSNLWAFTKNTPGVGSHRTYDPNTGIYLPEYSWSVSYGTGFSVYGDIYLDQVSVGRITYHKQAIGTAEGFRPPEFVKDHRMVFDGILGLAFSQINTVIPVRQNTFYENVKNDLSQPVFAAYLKHKAPGTYDFGFIDHKKHKGDLVWVEVDASYGFWNLTISGYAVGSFASFIPFHAIVDTGTTLLLLEQRIVHGYYGDIPSAHDSEHAGGYIFRCNEKIPDLILIIGHHRAVIPGDHIKYDSNGTWCYGGLQTSHHPHYGILGDVFLKSQHVVFNSSNLHKPRIGIANQR
ncbi:aspergillopepsin A precursor, putative [Talaromyces marneffei ATCC 18224]|uniref:Aspergillopepsin A, putative n=1 Tax=Talaromyces marneffei (strain ATCC 18224 / CBS 334.59 / QM 7333) TaxID=441960 RepID=B6Q9J3_TALMQ|nr:aspergillopepsin A precursor, putative [Talaromyces marneffei ATCC 18224]